MFWYTFIDEPPSQNGVDPQSISKMRMPSDHLSLTERVLAEWIKNIPVDRLVVASKGYNFRRMVFGCAA
jgi:hypothetical protein